MLPGQQQPGGQIHGGFGAISPPAPSSRLLGSLLAALLPTSCIPSTLVQTNIYIYICQHNVHHHLHPSPFNTRAEHADHVGVH